MYAAWNAGGIAALEPYVTDDLAWQDAPELPDSDSFAGKTATLARLSDFAGGQILGRQIEVAEIREANDYALVFMDAQASGGSAGAPSVQQKIIHLLHFAPDGRVDRAQAFFDRAAAEAAFAAASADSTVR